MRRRHAFAALVLLGVTAVGAPPLVQSMKGPGAACAAQHGCTTMADLLAALRCCATFCSGDLEAGCVSAVFGDGNEPAKNLATVQLMRAACEKIRDGGMPARDAQPVADSIALVATFYPDALTRERVQKIGSQVPLVAAAIKARAPHNDQGDLAPK